MASSQSFPHLSRITFFRSDGDRLVPAIADSIQAHSRDGGEVTRAAMAIHAWSRLLHDVSNGGFEQFFYNSAGDDGIDDLCSLLDTLGQPKPADLLREATAIYRRHRNRFQVANPWEGLFGSIKEFEPLERRIQKAGIGKANTAVAGWVRANIADLVVGDDSRPIDPNYTGVIEIKQPNGTAGESLEVKNGKAHGAYREFFEDGSVRQVIFYKSGKPSGDYWPSGQLRKKDSKRGDCRAIEWFYPSGKLQKRAIVNKSGYCVEPVRLYHENGQLAEEASTKGLDCFGPWLKFFDDGSAQLQAEFCDGRALVVHNAWDANRQQVVKDGAGVFDDDGRRITPTYALFFESDWRTVSDLVDGVPNGVQTTYHTGVLWSVNHKADGQHHGKSTTYWDNGRVRSIAEYDHGKELSTKAFPKFDKPVPAVLVSLEANERLYKAWRHIGVDEYPTALNLDEVQRQAQIPQFLIDVHQRNLAGQLKSDYESADTFDDGITYFLTVDAAGCVAEAAATGSSVYSGGEWDTYIPLLKQLRFTPGKIRGRAVACRVAAMVGHTFIESAS